MVRKVRPSASSPGSVPETLRDGLPLPKLAVFDLDYTLWPFWADTHPTPPVKKHPNKPLTAIDRYKTDYTTYAPTLPLLRAISDAGIRIGIASRTHAPPLARELMGICGVDEFVEEKLTEIYPGSKKKHMRVLRENAGVEFEDMLFFDDEGRNKEVESLGVRFVLVPDGVNANVWDKGVKYWRERGGGKDAGKAEEEEHDDGGDDEF